MKESVPTDSRWTLERAEGVVCGLLTAVMTLLVFAAVVMRYAFNDPIDWSDELARFLFTWLVFLGASVGVSRQGHISIDSLVQFLPASLRRTLAACVDGCLLIVLVILVYYGMLLCGMTFRVKTPSMGMSVALVYGAAPVGAMLMLIHHVLRIAVRYCPRARDGAIRSGLPAR